MLIACLRVCLRSLLNAAAIIADITESGTRIDTHMWVEGADDGWFPVPLGFGFNWFGRTGETAPSLKTPVLIHLSTPRFKRALRRLQSTTSPSAATAC